MNIYTGLLFLHGYRVDLDHDQNYREKLGNGPANERALRERWELDAVPEQPAANAAEPAVRPNNLDACA